MATLSLVSRPGRRFLVHLPTAAAVMTALVSSIRADEYAVFKSTDRARSWVRSDSGLPRHARVNGMGEIGDVSLVGTDAGVFRSTDVAATWQPTKVPAGVSARILELATMSTNVFAGTDGSGVLVSADNGSTWIPTAGLASGKVRSLLTVGSQLYAGMDTGGVNVSPDGGLSWRSVSDGLPPHAQVFALATFDGHVFAGLYTLGLYQLNPAGKSWTRAGGVKPLALAASTDTLIAGHNPGGIHWSSAPWTKWSAAAASQEGAIVSNVLKLEGELQPNDPVWALASRHNLSLVGAGAGIHVSQDGGRTWSRSQGGLPAQASGISFWISERFALAAIPMQPAPGSPFIPSGRLDPHP